MYEKEMVLAHQIARRFEDIGVPIQAQHIKQMDRFYKEGWVLVVVGLKGIYIFLPDHPFRDVFKEVLD